MLENDKAYQDHGLGRRNGNRPAGPPPAPVPQLRIRGGEGAGAARALDGYRVSRNEPPPEFEGRQRVRATDMMEDETGASAVELSKAIGRLKKSKSDADGSRGIGTGVKRVGNRTFHELGGIWVDASLTEGLPEIRVKYLSEAYFQLVEKLPELTEVLAIGERVVIVVNGHALIIDTEGADTLDAAQWAKLLGS